MARVLLFGRLSDIAGWRERIVEGVDTLAALRLRLAAQDARLGEALDCLGVSAAVDRALVRGDIALSAGSEVAFMPPMSGG